MITVPDGGGGFSYRFLPATGDDWIATSTSNPPSFIGFQLAGLTWNLTSFGTPPINPLKGYGWSGSYWNNAVGARPGSEDGSWTAEASGGGLEDDDDSEVSEADESDEDDAQ